LVVRGVAFALACVIAGAVAAQTAPAGLPPAAGGRDLVEALEAAPLAVVGTIESQRSLDARGWRAQLVVETVLSGTAPPLPRLDIAWEELVAARPPRFAAGDHVLVALEPLAPGSLWRQRVPDLADLARFLAIAQRSEAFLREPPAGSVLLLQHYLALPRELRASPAGQRHLVALVDEAPLSLAISAARRLAMLERGNAVGAPEATLVLHALARGGNEPDLGPSLLSWIERTQPVGLVPALDAALAASAPPPIFVRARGRLGDGLPAERARVLLASPSPELRAAAADVAGPAEAKRLAVLARDDRAPEVRSAALRRLVRVDASAALAPLLDACSDGDSAVRAAAAQQLTAFGPEVVPRLAPVAERPWPAPECAVAALARIGGDEARAALERLAAEHGDERVRTLAEVALGRPIGHED
jgi:hypothetical protein